MDEIDSDVATTLSVEQIKIWVAGLDLRLFSLR